MKLFNAFSLSMLPWAVTTHTALSEHTLIQVPWGPQLGDVAQLKVQQIKDIELVKDMLMIRGLESFVGHADTAAMLQAMLGLPVVLNRINMALHRDEEVMIAQYTGPRLPEGTTVLPPGGTIRWLVVSATW